MNKINIKQLGFATGITGALLYLGCVVIMATVGREGTIQFFNSLLHGVDTTSIIRMNVPILEKIIGLIETFIISWLIGVCIAAFYNLSIAKQK